ANEPGPSPRVAPRRPPPPRAPPPPPPAAGCAVIIPSSSLSAGGQLEHPSAVKSSTRTGTDLEGAAVSVLACPATAIPDNRSSPIDAAYRMAITTSLSRRGAPRAARRRLRSVAALARSRERRRGSMRPARAVVQAFILPPGAIVPDGLPRVEDQSAARR